jgi:hypothetical protein
VIPRLTATLEFDASADLESWRLSVPAHAACYSLEDEQGRTQLIATTGNLRNTLTRRLGPRDESQPSPGTDYRAIVRRVRYRPVYSRFEANWVYLENARLLQPRLFRKMMRHRRAAWICLNEADAHPRLVATDVPSSSHCFGPFATVKLARGLVQLLEDLFDLCREHHLLVQAPKAVACSYKQMGRCPAPCDGSITMEAYRAQIRAAVEFLGGDHAAFITDAQKRMKQAAAELQFERAGQIKGQIDKARNAPASRSVSAFRWLLLQRGSRKGRVRCFLIAPGVVEFAGEMLTKWRDEQVGWLADQARRFFSRSHDTDDAAAERTSLAAWHYVGGEREPGVFVPPEAACDVEGIRAAIERLMEKLAKRRGDRTGTAIHEQ